MLKRGGLGEGGIEMLLEPLDVAEVLTGLLAICRHSVPKPRAHWTSDSKIS